MNDTQFTKKKRKSQSKSIKRDQHMVELLSRNDYHIGSNHNKHGLGRKARKRQGVQNVVSGRNASQECNDHHIIRIYLWNVECQDLVDIEALVVLGTSRDLGYEHSWQINR